MLSEEKWQKFVQRRHQEREKFASFNLDVIEKAKQELVRDHAHDLLLRRIGIGIFIALSALFGYLLWLYFTADNHTPNFCAETQAVVFNGFSILMLLATIFYLGKQNRRLHEQNQTLLISLTQADEQTRLLSEQLDDANTQTHYISRQIQADLYDKAVKLTLEIDKLFLKEENLRFRPLFDGKTTHTAPLSDFPPQDRPRIETLGEFILDCFDGTALFLRQGIIDPKDKLEWERYIRDVFTHSRVMRDIFEENKAWYEHYLGPIFRGAETS